MLALLGSPVRPEHARSAGSGRAAAEVLRAYRRALPLALFGQMGGGRWLVADRSIVQPGSGVRRCCPGMATLWWHRLPPVLAGRIVPRISEDADARPPAPRAR